MKAEGVPEFEDRHVTSEVGDEGGAPGDVEIAVPEEAGDGSEATETWRPEGVDRAVVTDRKRTPQ